jgi:SOS-response transcriptional repressor LexA
MRQERGLTLTALAERVGIAKSYLSEIETGHKKPPSEETLGLLEVALGMEAGSLTRVARWQQTPVRVQEEMLDLAARGQAAKRLAQLIASDGIDEGGRLRGSLDAAYRTGTLAKLVAEVSGQGAPSLVPVAMPSAMEVPLINRVAAGYPAEFTDLGYPARIADEYVRCPGLTDPDAFAARVVGDSMEPEYREGDIVVFSPACEIENGNDCFARVAPDHESTFKRVYFERDESGSEMIRLQPINNRYVPRVYPRDEVLGLYRAVSVTRPLV